MTVPTYDSFPCGRWRGDFPRARWMILGGCSLENPGVVVKVFSASQRGSCDHPCVLQWVELGSMDGHDGVAIFSSL